MSSILDLLEAEAIYILRETHAQFSKPVLLFSGGKDSIVLAHLSKKAFSPVSIPFSFLHIDTGHNFEETISFRDNLVARLGVDLVVGSVEESIQAGRVNDETGHYPSRNYLQSVTLLDKISQLGTDALIGGARRDEEKARAKERIFSYRNEFGQWDPKNQRPEVWNILNGRLKRGEQMRVFPLSNWTEFDVWQYIKREKIEVPSLYFSHQRKCVVRKDGTILAWASFLNPEPSDPIENMSVRFRTIGDITCTGAVRSSAQSLDEIIRENQLSEFSERGTRADDMRSDSAMEDRKKEGYF